MRHKRLCWARREEEAAVVAECGKKKKGGSKGDKERSEQWREEGDYLHTHKKFLSEILLSHWKSKAADRALFSPSVSFLTHKRRTKTHSLCPHPAATVTAKHTLTHSHNPRESKRERTMGAERQDEAYC